MEGTDVHTGNVDDQPKNDHTFYGNGCENSYDSSLPYQGGSATACSTRLVSTLDPEMQKNGTYFTFSAATSTSGGSISSDNTNAPDTFCPLGWQLPYSGTGGDYYNQSRSWSYLFQKYSIISNRASVIRIRSYPFDYVYSGHYSLASAALFRQGNNYSSWSITNNMSEYAYRISVMDTFIVLNDPNTKYVAQPTRCNPRVSILILKHN